MIVTVNGKAVNVATGGIERDAGAPALIFVHGAGMDRSVWSFQARHLARHGYRVLAVDLPGHGRSECAACPTIGGYADWLIAFMNAMDLKTAALVGHSMGSLIVLDAAGRYPDRISTLCLLGTSQDMQVHPDLVAAAEADDLLADQLITDWGYGADAHIGGHPSPGSWIMGGGLALLGHAADGVIANDLKACMAYDAAVERAKTVACPTLVVMGDNDKMTPARAAGAIIAEIKDCGSVMIAHSGHTMMIERPFEMAKALKAVL